MKSASKWSEQRRQSLLRDNSKAVEAKLKGAKLAKGRGVPRYVRLPASGELEFYSGLSRAKLNTLILPTPERPVPPVQSIVLPNTYQNKKGVRLVLLDSLLAYLKQLEASQLAV